MPNMTRPSFINNKIMAAVFISSQGPISVHFVPKGTKITAEYYKNVILSDMIAKYKEKFRRSSTKHIVLHHDNARVHTAYTVTSFLESQRIRLMPHPPYSPDLAPCDFYLFGLIKDILSSREITCLRMLENMVEEMLFNLDIQEFENAFNNWARRLQRCIELGGEYIH